MKIGSTTPDQAGFPQTVSLTVTSAQIANLMCSFIESGDPVTRGWVQSVTSAPVHKKVCGSNIWYAEAVFYEQPGFILKIMTLDDDLEKPVEHLIGACAFHAGLTKLAAEPQYIYALLDLINDAGDAATADIVMQFVVFGKEVFA